MYGYLSVGFFIFWTNFIIEELSMTGYIFKLLTNDHTSIPWINSMKMDLANKKKTTSN